MSVNSLADIGADAPLRYTEPPIEIRIARHGRILMLLWPDQRRQTLTAATLRRVCRCAECTSARRRALHLDVASGIAIVDAQPIGAGALNIRFSDGHGRGIFPFAWLDSLSDESPPENVAP